MTPHEFAAKHQLPKRSPLKKVESWMVGYQRLQHLWQVYQDVTPEVRNSSAFTMRSVITQSPGLIGFTALAESVTSGQTTDRSLDHILGWFKKSNGDTSFKYHNLIATAVDKGIDLEQFLQTRKVAKPTLLELLNRARIRSSPVYAGPNYDRPGVMDIHLFQTSPNPFTSLRRIKERLNTLRENNSTDAYNTVRGVSWLINPGLRPLRNIGLTPDQGIESFFPDVNAMLVGEKWLPAGAPITAKEVFKTAFQCIIYSEKNIRSFILDGRLPDVGVVQIPADVFFTGKAKTTKPHSSAG